MDKKFPEYNLLGFTPNKKKKYKFGGFLWSAGVDEPNLIKLVSVVYKIDKLLMGLFTNLFKFIKALFCCFANKFFATVNFTKIYSKIIGLMNNLIFSGLWVRHIIRSILF